TTACKAGKTEVTLEQQRYFFDREPLAKGSKEQWEIPVCFTRAEAQGSSCHLLAAKKDTFTLPGCSDWFNADARGRGYYRVEYDAANLAKLSEVAEKQLDPGERLSLLNSAWALVRADRNSVGDYLALVDGMKQDRERAIVGEYVEHLDFIHDHIVSGGDKPRYEAWVRELLRPAMAELGWQKVAGEPGER